MLLNALFIIAIIFSTIFLILFFRTFSSWQQIKNIWKNSAENIKRQKENKEKIEKLEAAGNKKFTFDNGRVEIYAKTQLGAMYNYNQLKRKLKNARKDAVQRKR